MNDERVLSRGWIMLKTTRGPEMGLLGGTLTEEQESRYRMDVPKNDESTEAIIQDVEFVREANADDLENYYMCRHEEEFSLLRARDILSIHRMEMKVVDVEYTLDRSRFYVYFTAEQRVDFRSYVRDLAHEFRTRIEMRQVGFRDEARIVKGLSSCGRPCCCSYWLRGFSPISIKIVKEQRTALNPTKISGLCGRLMCCMSYEQELYSELWAKLPGPGSKIKTEKGSYLLESLDLGRERVNVRFPSGRLVPVLISEFPDFQETVLRGDEWGEDKELAAKKKAAQERIARLERAKQARLARRNNQKGKTPKGEARSTDSQRPKSRNKPRPKQNVQPQSQPPEKREGQSRRRRSRKPHQPQPQQ